MMPALQIGSPIETYDLYVRRQSLFGFVINWWTDDAHTIPRNDIDGKTFRVVVGDRAAPIKTWETVAEGNVTSFFLSVEDSTLDFSIYDGVILVSPGPDELALANVRIIVEPS
jgi:hypothetical protein